MQDLPDSSDEREHTSTEELPTDSVQRRLAAALELKDYAINANLDVDDSILQKLAGLQGRESFSPSDEYNLDAALRDLTAITYPTTVETLRASRGPGGLNAPARRFMRALIILGPFVLFIALLAVWQSEASDKRLLWQSLIAVCLGLLGSLVYIFFNLIGVMAEKAFTPDDTYANSVRLVLGAIVGWVFFFAFSRDQTSPVLLLLPFAAGYSTRLVVGLINQVIGAVELTLGLDDKTSSLLSRKARRKRPQP